VAVKTGTSSNCHDGWAVAYSRRFLVAAWVGHPDYRPMRRLGGYRSAAVLVKKVLARLHRSQADGQEDVGFPPPRGFVPVRLCALTGETAAPACDRVFLEYFPAVSQPPRSCRAHLRRAVDTRNGLLGTSRTPLPFLEIRTFVDLAPRYAAWQTVRGLPRPPHGVSPLLGEARSPTPTWTVSATGSPRLQAIHQTLRITSPASDLRVLRDPETPAAQATLALEAVVDPPSEQVIWYVDGEAYRLADYPYTVRWPLDPGEHTIEARLPFTQVASAPVRVTVY
jgi:membrane carboxypeptidase/penicillin-binding protein PbpC